MAKLTTIEGVGPVLSEKLRGAGVGSTDTLLRAGASKTGRRNIAAKSGIDEGRVLKFVNHADLMRVKGIGGEYAELLDAAGVDTIPELGNRNSTNLSGRMKQENDARKLVRLVPSQSRVSEWVRQAKTLDRIITY